MTHLDRLTEARWGATTAVAGPDDCVPIAMSLVEGISFGVARARCEFFHKVKPDLGYPSYVLGYARGRPLKLVPDKPIKGYASWPDHVAPIINGRILLSTTRPDTPRFYV